MTHRAIDRPSVFFRLGFYLLFNFLPRLGTGEILLNTIEAALRFLRKSSDGDVGTARTYFIRLN